MAEVSFRDSLQGSVPAESISNGASGEAGKQLKPTLVKPEGQPKRDVVDFYVGETLP